MQKRRNLGKKLSAEDASADAGKPKVKAKAKGKPSGSNDHSADAAKRGVCWSRVDGGTKKVIVPGSRAPTVRVPPLFNSMLRLLAKHSDSLGGFLQSFLSNEPRPRDEAISLGPLWRIPLPYHPISRSFWACACFWSFMEEETSYRASLGDELAIPGASSCLPSWTLARSQIDWAPVAEDQTFGGRQFWVF